MKPYHLGYAVLFTGLMIMWLTLALITMTDAQALAQCEQVMSADACQYTLIK